MGNLDKEIEMLKAELQKKSGEEYDLMFHTVQCMLFLNKALKNNYSKLLSALLALDDSAEIHWKKEDSTIHASVYHLIPRQELMELDIELLFSNSACITKAKFL